MRPGLIHQLFSFDLKVMRAQTLQRSFLLLTCLILSACSLPTLSQFGAPGETKPGEISFQLAPPNDAAILVPVKINGQGPYTFVLDTGATFTCIDQPLATELKLPEWNQQVGIGIAVPTANAAKLVDVETLEVGTASAQKLKACVIDFKNFQSAGLNIHGLLGLNFLKSYHVNIDFQRKVVKLDPITKER
jgi:predicted aspartyl protease